MSEKTLDVTSQGDAQKKVSDVVIVGNTNTAQLLCKASSKAQGWMKSTKAMEIPGVGCVVQVTTQQGTNTAKEGEPPVWKWSVAEALTFVPGVKIVEDVNGGRKLVAA